MTAIKEICNELQADHEEVCSSSKTAHISRIRNTIIYELLEQNDSEFKLYSNGEIAEFFKKDISGIRKIVLKQRELFTKINNNNNIILLEYHTLIRDKLRENKLIM